MRLLLCFILLFFTILSPHSVVANDSVVLKTGISLDEMVPDALFGTWRVKSDMLETNSKGTFKQNNVDLWNISKSNSVITLDNPFSGAKASISIREVEDNKIVFEKEGRYDNKILSDTVELYLDRDKFKGTNYLKLTTVSDVDGRIMEVQTAKYSLIGDKVSGYNVLIEE